MSAQVHTKIKSCQKNYNFLISMVCPPFFFGFSPPKMVKKSIFQTHNMLYIIWLHFLCKFQIEVLWRSKCSHKTKKGYSCQQWNMVKLSDGSDLNLCLSTDTASKLFLWTKGESSFYFKVMNFFTLKSLIITFMPIIVPLKCPTVA